MRHQLLQHVVQELEAGVDGRCPFPVQVYPDVNIRLAGLAGYHSAALSAADGLHNLFPGERSHLQPLAPEVPGQLQVGLPVSDDPGSRHIITPVQVLSEHPRAGLAAGRTIGREVPVNEDVVKHHALSFEGLQKQILGRPEGFFGEGRCPQPVLVGCHHQLVSESGECLHAGDGSGNEDHLVEGVDLLVGGLLEERSVAVYENDFTHSYRGFEGVGRSRRAFPP